jgi:hypothetical protein
MQDKIWFFKEGKGGGGLCWITLWDENSRSLWQMFLLLTAHALLDYGVYDVDVRNRDNIQRGTIFCRSSYMLCARCVRRMQTHTHTHRQKVQSTVTFSTDRTENKLRGANKTSANQEIPRSLRPSKIYYSVHKSQPPIPNLCQINLLYAAIPLLGHPF